jgi:hypothetical protein
MQTPVSSNRKKKKILIFLSSDKMTEMNKDPWDIFRVSAKSGGGHKIDFPPIFIQLEPLTGLSRGYMYLQKYFFGKKKQNKKKFFIFLPSEKRARERVKSLQIF